MHGKGEQPDLFRFGAHGDITAANHGGNAESEEAHKDVAPFTHNQRAAILDFLRANPEGKTCEEIRLALDMSHQSCSSRCSELKALNKIRANGARRATASGSSAAVLVIY